MFRRTMYEGPCYVLISVFRPFLFRRDKYYERYPILKEILTDTAT